MAELDVFICADVSNAAVRVGSYRHLEHSVERCAALGLHVEIPEGRHRCLWFCGDYALYCAVLQIPEYDYYIMIEYDVYFSAAGLAWLSALCAWLRQSRLDCFAPTLERRAPPTWYWHAHAQRVGGFRDVAFCILPVLLLSKAAALHLLAVRLRQAAALRQAPAPIAFCEYFVPSTLQDAGFVLHDLRDLPEPLRGVAHPHFTSNRPICFTDEAALAGLGDVVHPVLDLPQYIRKAASVVGNDAPPLALTRWLLDSAARLPEAIRATPELAALLAQAQAKVEAGR